MNKYKIKRLAEQHFYFDKKLTPEERYILENSEYKSILKRDSAFEKQLKRYNINEQEESQPEIKVKKRRRMFVPNISRQAIANLVDDVEMHFNLGILNQSADRFSKVNLDELKEFIKNYADKNIYDFRTLREVERVLDSDSVYLILHKLYSLE